MNLCNIGYSDHTCNISVILNAIIKGAKYIEMHVDLDDGKGKEYSYGHCWCFSRVLKLKTLLNEITISESLYFCKANTNELADAKTGLRG